MDWQDKTVSMGNVKKDEFDLHLATVIVSDSRIAVDPHDVEDWGRIFEELGTDKILEEVRWEEVEEVSITDNELYYPHIDVILRRNLSGEDEGLNGREQRRIYFTEDEADEMNRCFNAIKKYWNKWRQHNIVEDERFPNELERDEDLEEVELEEVIGQETQRQEPAPETGTAETQDETPGSPQSEQPQVAQGAQDAGTDESEDADEERTKDFVGQIQADTERSEQESAPQTDGSVEPAGEDKEGKRSKLKEALGESEQEDEPDTEPEAARKEASDEEDESEDGGDIDELVDKFLDQD